MAQRKPLTIEIIEDNDATARVCTRYMDGGANSRRSCFQKSAWRSAPWKGPRGVEPLLFGTLAPGPSDRRAGGPHELLVPTPSTEAAAGEFARGSVLNP